MDDVLKKELGNLFSDVSSGQMIPSSDQTKNIVKMPDNIDIISQAKQSIAAASSHFWTIKDCKTAYSTGSLMGKNVNSFESFLKSFTKLFEMIIRNELDKEGKTAEQYDSDFKMLYYCFGTILGHLKDNKFDIKSPSYIALFQGLINSSLDNVK